MVNWLAGWLRISLGTFGLVLVLEEMAEQRVLSSLEEVVEIIDGLLGGGGGGEGRRMMAIVGPPGVGKSTLVGTLESHYAGEENVRFLPMDGFHLDNAVLEADGTLDRKGAPHTFDVGGLEAALSRISGASPLSPPVVLPTFDRGLDKAIAGAIRVPPPPCDGGDVIVMEGNYLACADLSPEWARVASLFPVSLYIDADADALSAALVSRWLEHGLDADAALVRAQSNDIPNGESVATCKGLTTFLIHQSSLPHPHTL